MAYESFRPNKCSVPISDFVNFLALLGWPRTKTLRNGFQTGIIFRQRGHTPAAGYEIYIPKRTFAFL